MRELTIQETEAVSGGGFWGTILGIVGALVGMPPPCCCIGTEPIPIPVTRRDEDHVIGLPPTNRQVIFP